MEDFNQFDGLRFARTQPDTWRSIPFAGDRTWWRGWRIFLGWAVFWVAVFSVSIWSINDSISNQPTQARIK